ncbi:unnamed protein product [Closterium sp. Naga37s-1]|nr:unnamed protein product [Closterium sp. Naga37s-1]
MVVNVWPFLEANSRAWEVLTRGGSALDAVVEGCNVCEVLHGVRRKSGREGGDDTCALSRLNTGSPPSFPPILLLSSPSSGVWRKSGREGGNNARCHGYGWDPPLHPISSLFHRSIPPITNFSTLCLHHHFPFSPPIFSPSHSLAPPQPLPFLPLLPIANASMNDSMDVGAVAGLRRVKAAVRAAYLVLLHTYHSLLVGDAAMDFVLEMGLAGPEDLSTNRSLAMWRQWKAASCQPNYWRNVTPDAARSCGPYRPASEASASEPRGGATAEPQGAEAGAVPGAGPGSGPGGMRVGCDPSLVGRQQGSLRRQNRLASHDTISMVAIAQNGTMAAATSTNGLTFHIPGRVGDAPIAGAGAYVDSKVGGCGATGDGDVMMRFLPCFLAVELMRMGSTPASAAEAAISRIRAKFPTFVGGLVAVNRCNAENASVPADSPETEVANLSIQSTADDKANVGAKYEAREVGEEEIGADREGEIVKEEEEEGLGNGRIEGREEMERGVASDATTVAAVAEEEDGMDTGVNEEEEEAEANEEGSPSTASRPTRATSRSSLLTLYRFFSSHLGISSPSTVASLLASYPQLLRSNPTNDFLPRVRLLQSFGISHADISFTPPDTPSIAASVIRRAPTLLSLTTDTLLAKLQFFVELVGEEVTGKVARSYSKVLVLSKENVQGAGGEGGGVLVELAAAAGAGAAGGGRGDSLSAAALLLGPLLLPDGTGGGVAATSASATSASATSASATFASATASSTLPLLDLLQLFLWAAMSSAVAEELLFRGCCSQYCN